MEELEEEEQSEYPHDPACTVCIHPGRAHIEHLLGRRKLDKLSWMRIKDAVVYKYPHENAPTREDLVKHALYHMPPLPATAAVGSLPEQPEPIKLPGLIKIENRWCITDGTPIEDFDLGMVAQAMLAIGFQNLMLKPEKVTPKVLVEVMEVLLRIKGGAVLIDEFLQAWTAKLHKTGEDITKPPVLDAEEYGRVVSSRKIEIMKKLGLDTELK